MAWFLFSLFDPGLYRHHTWDLAPGVENFSKHDSWQARILKTNTKNTLNYFRDRHGLVTVGSRLYAVGGSRSIGSERSIEMFDGEKWQEVGETNGYRST